MNRPKKVDVYELDTLIGSLSYDGRQIVLDPPGDGVLKLILDEPVLTAQGVFDKSQPEAFLDALPKQYRGAYLRVVPVGNSSN